MTDGKTVTEFWRAGIGEDHIGGVNEMVDPDEQALKDAVVEATLRVIEAQEWKPLDIGAISVAEFQRSRAAKALRAHRTPAPEPARCEPPDDRFSIIAKDLEAIMERLDKLEGKAGAEKVEPTNEAMSLLWRQICAELKGAHLMDHEAVYRYTRRALAHFSRPTVEISDEEIAEEVSRQFRDGSNTTSRVSALKACRWAISRATGQVQEAE